MAFVDPLHTTRLCYRSQNFVTKLTEEADLGREPWVFGHGFEHRFRHQNVAILEQLNDSCDGTCLVDVGNLTEVRGHVVLDDELSGAPFDTVGTALRAELVVLDQKLGLNRFIALTVGLQGLFDGIRGKRCIDGTEDL